MSSSYVSSKFALEGLSESMAYELEQFGIKIILIEPGVIDTNFTFVTPKKALGTYSNLMNKIQTNLFSTLANGTSPKVVANAILNAVTEENPERRYLVGNDAIELINARKNSTDKDFEKIIVGNLLG